MSGTIGDGMANFGAGLAGLLLGAVVTILLVGLVTAEGGTLGIAREKYAECLSVGASQDACVKKYFLKEADRP